MKRDGMPSLPNLVFTISLLGQPNTQPKNINGHMIARPNKNAAEP